MRGIARNPLKPVSTIASNCPGCREKGPRILTCKIGLFELLPKEPVHVGIRRVTDSKGTARANLDQVENPIWSSRCR